MMSVTAEPLAQAEKRLRRRLPDFLRQRLLAEGGGSILVDGEPWALHRVPGVAGARPSLAGHIPVRDIVTETIEARRWRSFPRAAVAVASNGFGDHVILRAGVDVLEIWEHETGSVVQARIEWISPNEKSPATAERPRGA